MEQLELCSVSTGIYNEKKQQKKKETANVFYKLSNKKQIEIKFSSFDLERLENLNMHVRIPLKEFLELIPSNIEFILLFGSASRKEEKKESDIDLLVVLHHFDSDKLNELYQKEIKESIEQVRKRINTRSLYPLSIVFVNNKDYKEKKDYLLEAAKKTGFCIYNHENYYKEELKDEN